jgi:hypothetical protein
MATVQHHFQAGSPDSAMTPQIWAAVRSCTAPSSGPDARLTSAWYPAGAPRWRHIAHSDIAHSDVWEYRWNGSHRELDGDPHSL